MDLRHFRYFVVVAEELHVTRAAARLHIAQPALSHHIREIERELGVTLLDRSKRRIALTDAGRAFLERVRITLEEASSAQRAAQRAARGELDRIEVGFLALVGSDLLPRAIRAYRRRFPHVEIGIREMGDAAQAKGLASGDLHLGLTDRVLVHDDLRNDVVGREPLSVALPAKHPLASKRAIALRDLATERLIAPPGDHRAPPYMATLLAACAEAGFTPKIAYRIAIHTAFVLVASGLGVYVLPGLRRAREARDDVVIRPLRPVLTADFFAVRRRDAESAQLRAFVDTLRTRGNVRE